MMLRRNYFTSLLQLICLTIMNTGPMRKLNPPLTPNLEQYKQKNKSKSKRKPCSIQPTNPPTPKVPKVHINMKQQTHDKFAEISSKESSSYCFFHPERIGTSVHDQNGKRLCQKCVQLSSKNEDEYDEELQIQKRNQLNEFKERIKGFGLRVQEAEQSYIECCHQSQQYFFGQKQYIDNTIEYLKGSLEEKRRQLINNLVIGQQKIKKSLLSKNQIVSEIKSSINRYIEDIDCNYDDIIKSLSYHQFNEILDLYNNKITFFSQRLQTIEFETTLNVFIPTKQLMKEIERYAVRVYPWDHEEQTTNSFNNKTMQRYPTEKNNLFSEYQVSHLHKAKHPQLRHNNISQHRQSRDRHQLIHKDPSLGQTRNHTNKENYFSDNAALY